MLMPPLRLMLLSMLIDYADSALLLTTASEWRRIARRCLREGEGVSNNAARQRHRHIVTLAEQCRCARRALDIDAYARCCRQRASSSGGDKARY